MDAAAFTRQRAHHLIHVPLRSYAKLAGFLGFYMTREIQRHCSMRRETDAEKEETLFRFTDSRLVVVVGVITRGVLIFDTRISG